MQQNDVVCGDSECGGCEIVGGVGEGVEVEPDPMTARFVDEESVHRLVMEDSCSEIKRGGRRRRRGRGVGK